MGKLYISNSLVKYLFLNGNERPNICPKQVFSKFVIKNYPDSPTRCMLDGKYFETLCLGSSSRGDKQLDLPRLNNGNKGVTQLRIEKQVLLFKLLCEKYQIRVNEHNTQTVYYKEWHKDRRVILRAEMDIAPTTILRNIDNQGEALWLSIIDLKLTVNINSDWGEFGWGDYANMDKTQGMFYQYMWRDMDVDFNISESGETWYESFRTGFMKELIEKKLFLFYYWVFSHAKTGMDHQKLCRVVWDKAKELDLHEAIRKTVSLMELWNEEGFKANPSYEACKDCKLENCKEKTTEEEG